MGSPLVQVAIILIFAVFNGILAMSEIAVVSARKARLRQEADTGNRRARNALALAEDPTNFLAAVQIGITLIGILAGAFGEATLAANIALRLRSIAFLEPYSEIVAAALVVLLVTYISLVIGELTPKRLALNNAERVAALVAGPMQALAKITRPIVWLLSTSSEGLLRLLGVKLSNELDVTPEEIAVLIEQGTELGVFEESEQDMIESVLRLDERRVDAFMTPRTQIEWIDVEDSEDEIRSTLLDAKHSRFPVIEDDPDNVLGILYTKDMVVRNLEGKPLDIRATLRPVMFVPESMSTLRVLELFKQEGNHIALLTDEYGSVQGMVTDMDLLEAIVGEIVSEGEPEEPQALEREDGTWLVDGMLRVERLWEILGVEAEMDVRYHGYQTVSGFVMAHLKGLPSEGRHFDYHGMRIEIMDMDGRRVDKVLITPRSEVDDAARDVSAGA
ncbi:MAG: HlyC/CorC family transporter [Anaerolineae bacterium]|nr:HlyC/CorC family transporter [Anaerolineae bacterium]